MTKHYYEDGQLKYEALFNADTLLGKATNYYEDGSISAEGNTRNGKWVSYHKNGQIASLEEYKNGSLTGDRIKYNENGDQILPIFQKSSNADSSVINATNLKVSVMFDQTNRENSVLRFGESLFYGPQIIPTEDGVLLQYGYNQIVIMEDGVYLKNSATHHNGAEIQTITYGTNRRAVELDNGEIDLKYINKDVNHETSLGKLIVHIQQLQCDDTGSNPITIERLEGELEIRNINNLQFFEHDINKDGKKELYILSYACCEGYLKIYKIEE